MNEELAPCLHCGCAQMEHITWTAKGGLVKSRCLKAGGCKCPGFEATAPSEKPAMFSVRIDRTPEGYTFKIEPMPWGIELVALDSTPGVIAFVEAPDPGAACARAWEKGQRELASLGGLPSGTPEQLLALLGDKTPEGGHA